MWKRIFTWLYFGYISDQDFFEFPKCMDMCICVLVLTIKYTYLDTYLCNLAFCCRYIA